MIQKINMNINTHIYIKKSDWKSMFEQQRIYNIHTQNNRWLKARSWTKQLQIQIFSSICSSCVGKVYLLDDYQQLKLPHTHTFWKIWMLTEINCYVMSLRLKNMIIEEADITHGWWSWTEVRHKNGPENMVDDNNSNSYFRSLIIVSSPICLIIPLPFFPSWPASPSLLNMLLLKKYKNS